MLALAGELASREGVEVALYLGGKAGPPPSVSRFRTVFVKVSGFSRRPGIEDLEALAALAAAFYRCRWDMRERRPRAAVAFGGYACLPGALAALSLRVPLIIHEQNVIPGSANRLLAAAARVIAVSFPETLTHRPSWRAKAVVTGNPLLARGGGDGDPYSHFRLHPGRKTVAVIGGSQGAASLNRAVLEALPLWKERRDLQVVHAVGRDKYQEFMQAAAKVDYGDLVYRPLDFIERMDLLYRAADLVVCRSGASTIAELAMAGKAAILVPYPHATAGHQDANAEVLRAAGAAVVIPDREMSGERLVREVEGLLGEEGRLAEMGRAALRVARPDAVRRLADAVLSLAGEGE
nr:UDP-N-acetylglucosamine--N-acetylmuramyl-(pentapeptide) pyrophosphoryl-undecaprenol N-acetylglucosamine transferase [Candidatus Solincola tengchongensis]